MRPMLPGVGRRLRGPRASRGSRRTGTRSPPWRLPRSEPRRRPVRSAGARPARPGAAGRAARSLGETPDLELLTQAHPAEPGLDLAVAQALLRAVGAGERGDALRLVVPAPTVAFGRLDERLAGFPEAVAAARAHGYAPVVRRVGGHAAPYDEGSLVVEHVVATHEGPAGMHRRFDAEAELLAGALADLGLDARVGELPGEYCPGAHSLNVGGRLKVGGLAQRTVRGAALVSASLVVTGGDALRAVVADVYAALGLEVDPAVAGALDEALPGLDVPTVAQAVTAAHVRAGSRVVPGRLAEDLIDEARRSLA
jgi:octanoyl-[GcvH]:protein N-octanoyltransferase